MTVVLLSDDNLSMFFVASGPHVVVNGTREAACPPEKKRAVCIVRMVSVE